MTEVKQSLALTGRVVSYKEKRFDPLGSSTKRTYPEVDVIHKESSQHLIQGSIHLQPSGSSHQPLQQLLEL